MLNWALDPAGPLKTEYTEENVKEISIEGSIQDVYNRIRTSLYPFFVRYDDDTLVRVSADVQEGEEG